MYTRVTTAYAQPDKIDEMIQIYHESIIPALKQQPGFHSFLAISDRASGKGMVLATWDTEEAMQAAETSGFYAEQVAKLLPLTTSQPTRETFEVVVSA
jgi:quinol monooxygenase YgiN